MRAVLIGAGMLALAASAAQAITIIDATHDFADREAMAAAAPFVATGSQWSVADGPAPATSQWLYRRKPAQERGRYISRSGFDFDDEDQAAQTGPARAK